MKYSSIVCPHCGHVYSEGDLAMAEWLSEGDLAMAEWLRFPAVIRYGEFEEHCVQCGKIILVKVSVIKEYETSKKEVPS